MSSKKTTEVRIIVGSRDDANYIKQQLAGMTTSHLAIPLEKIVQDKKGKVYYTQQGFHSIAQTITQNVQPTKEITVCKRAVTLLVDRIKGSLEKGIEQTIILFDASSPNKQPLLLMPA